MTPTITKLNFILHHSTVVVQHREYGQVLYNTTNIPIPRSTMRAFTLDSLVRVELVEVLRRHQIKPEVFGCILPHRVTLRAG